MEPYRKTLKEPARALRTRMTDAEQALWHRIRRKQIQNVQFYRQKPLFSLGHQAEDRARDAALAGLGLQVLRFDNRQVLLETDAVLAVIDEAVKGRV
jgi:very-short-patch-repair endonuclease